MKLIFIGRLEKLLYVPLPDAAGRLHIIKTVLRNTPVDNTDVNVNEMAGISLSLFLSFFPSFLLFVLLLLIR
jgi:SpoVK/Ycf46/Vps4 family AAA+-type ATPase